MIADCGILGAPCTESGEISWILVTADNSAHCCLVSTVVRTRTYRDVHTLLCEWLLRTQSNWLCMAYFTSFYYRLLWLDSRGEFTVSLFSAFLPQPNRPISERASG